MLHVTLSLVLIALSVGASAGLAGEMEMGLLAQRGEKTYGVGIVDGLLDGPGVTGFEGFLLLNRHVSIGLAAERQQNLLGFSWDRGRQVVKSQADGVFLEGRLFAIDSFYLKGAVGYRILNVDVYESDRKGSEDLDVSMEQRSMVVGGGLGNMWTFGPDYYVGVEWFGAYRPMRATHHMKFAAQANKADERQALEEKVKKLKSFLLDLPTSHLLAVNAGMMF